MDELAHDAFVAQRLVDRGHQGHGERAVGLDPAAFGGDRLDQHVAVGKEQLVAVGEHQRRRAGVAQGGHEGGRVGRLEGRPDGADLLAQARSEQLEVGLERVGEQLLGVGHQAQLA